MNPFDPQQLPAQLAGLPIAGRICVSFSGGVDSSALLHGAAAVRDRLPGPLWALHIDHGLNPSSALWSERCRAMAEALSVPFRSHRLALTPTQGESLEAVARAARYRALAGRLSPGEVLLTAHNLDDQAETMLLAMVRGSGVHGLAAMPKVASLGPGLLVRPLLDIPRSALETYAKIQGIDWIEDPSNATLAHDRNFLRHRVLPALRERWPAVSTTLARSAGHCAEAADLVDRAAAMPLRSLAGTRPGTLSVCGLRALDPPQARAVLRLWVRHLGLPLPNSRRLGRILTEAVTARADASPLVAWSGAEVRRYRDDLYALQPLPPAPPKGLTLDWPYGLLRLPEPLGSLRIESGSAGLPERRALAVAFRLDGLACRPSGRQGTHRLKHLFQEAGIPVWLRPFCPLVLREGNLVAVPGVSRCEPRNGGSRPPSPRIRWLGHPWESFGFFD